MERTLITSGKANQILITGLFESNKFVADINETAFDGKIRYSISSDVNYEFTEFGCAYGF